MWRWTRSVFRMLRKMYMSCGVSCAADYFVEHHHFGPAKWWYVVHGTKQYDSKAIVGVAIGIQTGHALTSNDFKGGESNAVRNSRFASSSATAAASIPL